MGRGRGSKESCAHALKRGGQQGFIQSIKEEYMYLFGGLQGEKENSQKVLYDLVSDWTGMSNEALGKVRLIFILYYSC